MKSTGIVRKIDRLGRVVIPKEIRKTLRIRVGDPLEIFTDRDGQIIFKKYSPIAELSNIASEYGNTLSETLECCVVICDKDAILAVSGEKLTEYEENYTSKALSSIIERGKVNQYAGSDLVEVIDREDMSGFKSQIVHPILVEEDPIGAVVILSESEFSDIDRKVLQTVAKLIERHMDC